MINRVTLIGNLGTDPQIRHLESGAVVASFPVATNENYRDKSGEWQTITQWHDIVAWRRLAESAERNLKKGSLVYIEGKLTKRKWQDKEGNDRYTVEVVANVLKSLDKRESSGLGSGPAFPGAGDEYPPTGNRDDTSGSGSGPAETDDDLPF